jgi:hypothetical protein
MLNLPFQKGDAEAAGSIICKENEYDDSRYDFSGEQTFSDQLVSPKPRA